MVPGPSSSFGCRRDRDPGARRVACAQPLARETSAADQKTTMEPSRALKRTVIVAHIPVSTAIFVRVEVRVGDIVIDESIRPRFGAFREAMISRG